MFCILHYFKSICKNKIKKMMFFIKICNFFTNFK